MKIVLVWNNMRVNKCWLLKTQLNILIFAINLSLFDADTRYSVCRAFWESNAFVNPKRRLCECSHVWSPLTHTCAFSITLLDKMAKDWIVLPRTMGLPKLRWNKTINHRHPHHTLKSKELTFAQFHHLTTLSLQRWQHLLTVSANDTSAIYRLQSFSNSFG